MCRHTWDLSSGRGVLEIPAKDYGWEPFIVSQAQEDYGLESSIVSQAWKDYGLEPSIVPQAREIMDWSYP